ncbi:MAG: radical SAM protein [Synergistes sp.]|nr:radical SAM protein [Synergistes sp.]
MKVFVGHTNVKSLLSPTKLGADFVINPYIGCPHGCIYCYAASGTCKKWNENRKWGTFVNVKIPTEKIRGAKLCGKSILLSSMTDAYNPYEARSLVTRHILEALVPTEPQIVIITKSALVVRDIDIFTKFPHVHITFSFSSLEDDFRRKAEPYAASPDAKIKAMARLHDAGIDTSVMAAPIFPMITDGAAIARATAPYTSHIMFDTLNVRSGNRDRILSFATDLRPDLKDLYEAIYLHKDRSFWHQERERLKKACDFYGMECKTLF